MVRIANKVREIDAHDRAILAARRELDATRRELDAIRAEIEAFDKTTTGMRMLVDDGWLDRYHATCKAHYNNRGIKS